MAYMYHHDRIDCFEMDHTICQACNLCISSEFISNCSDCEKKCCPNCTTSVKHVTYTICKACDVLRFYNKYYDRELKLQLLERIECKTERVTNDGFIDVKNGASKINGIRRTGRQKKQQNIYVIE